MDIDEAVEKILSHIVYWDTHPMGYDNGIMRSAIKREVDELLAKQRNRFKNDLKELIAKHTDEDFMLIDTKSLGQDVLIYSNDNLELP